MPNLGPDYDLAQRLTRLERLVAGMTSQLGQAFSATQSDGSVGMSILQRQDQVGATAMTFYQGPTTARDANTGLHQALLYIGQIYSGGQAQDAGALWYRPTGTESAVIGNRGVQVYDTQGHQVLGTDEYGTSPSGQGLNSPWIPLGQPVTGSPGNTGWPNTSSATLAAVSFLNFPAQHSHLTWYGTTYLAAGAAGQVQVGISGGAAGAVHPVGAGFTNLNETFSLGTWSWQQELQLSASAALTSGTGPIYFAIFGVWGCGSGF